MSSLRFSEVISALNSIPEIERTDELESLIEQAENYSQQRQVASQALVIAEESGIYAVAIVRIVDYLAEIANAGLQDPQLQQMLDEAKGKESASIRNKKLIKLGIVAACVVVVLITGVAIKINNDAKAVETAIANLDWVTALELDPSNSDGLRLKAAEQAAEKGAILAGGPITKRLGMTLNKIPAGTFMMGSPESETGRGDDETQHEVTISKAFYMQTTEVTQEQWKALMGTEPWKGQRLVKEGPNYAASYVSWNDAVAYCEKLSEKESVTYRLPTEAEWEYACRAETKTTWSFGDDEASLGDYAWHDKNVRDIDERYAHQVRLKKPNAFGLFDMHGNVWEWCHDYYGEDYYKQSPANDPQGPASGSFRVLRGGSWILRGSRYSRSAYRNRNVADLRNDFGVVGFGFRLVRGLD